MVLIIALERRRSRAGKNPMIVLAFEQARRHGRARADGLRIEHPLLHPIGLQAAASLEEIRCGGDAVVRGISGGMALEARRSRAAKEAAGHFGFLGSKNGNFFRNVRERLARKGLEEADEFAEFVFGKRERG